MKPIALNGIVIIKSIEEKERKLGSLLVAETKTGEQKTPHKKGEVIAVAADCKQKVSVGDVVMFLKSGVQATDFIDGESVDFVREGSLLSVI